MPEPPAAPPAAGGTPQRGRPRAASGPVEPWATPRRTTSAPFRSGSASRRHPAAEDQKDLRRVDWSSDVATLLSGRAADEHDPGSMQREYFRVSELYTRRLSTRLAGEGRDSNDRFLRLVCQTDSDGLQRKMAVELVLDSQYYDESAGAQDRSSYRGALKLVAQDDETPTQSRPEWLWRLNDGVIESRLDGFAICVLQDRSVCARKLRHGDHARQTWSLTSTKQLQHTHTGLLLSVDGQFLSATPAEAVANLQWAVHRHDVQTLRVQLRAKRTTKWRDAKQRVLVATLGRYERVVALAHDDSRYTARLPQAELSNLNETLDRMIHEGHSLRDVLLLVQALAEAKFENGNVRQCVRIYMAGAQRLLKEVHFEEDNDGKRVVMAEGAGSDPEPRQPEPEPETAAKAEETLPAGGTVYLASAVQLADKEPEEASPGSTERKTRRASVHLVAARAAPVPDYLLRMQQADATAAAEVQKAHADAPSTDDLEAALRAALDIALDAPISERYYAFRAAFGGGSEQGAPAPASLEIIPELGLELQRLPRDQLRKKNQQKEFFPIFRSPFTGLPCLGPGAIMRQIEPPPVSEIDSDPSVVQPVDWHTARKVEFGPLQERDGSVGETWELSWDEEGKKEWPALLRVLQQLTGQVVWPARQARGMSLPGDSQGGSTDDTDVDDDMFAGGDRSPRVADGEREGEADGDTLDRPPRQMCSSSQFSFTVPPVVCEKSAFLIRVRFGSDTSLLRKNFRWQTDGIADPRGWVNPLSWRNGDYFAPKFRRQTEYFVRPDHAEILPPPPVVLGKTWEASHIINHDREEDVQSEGDLRIFSILGLTPSCTANGAKVFGYGASRVELEVSTAYGMTWEEANLEDNLWIWKTSYDVPPESMGTVLVKTFVESMHYRGLPAIEESLMGQVDRNRKKNLKTIREFVEESWEKLQPWYAYKVQPWLASHSLTYLFVDSSRAMMLREK